MPSRRGRGEGSIYRRGDDGRWVGSVSIAETGGRRSVTGRTRQEVQRKLAAMQRGIEDGLPTGDARQTVGQYLTSWLETIKPTIGAGTWEMHESYTRIHTIPALGRVKLINLSPQHVQEFYAALLEEGLSTTTVHHLHASLHKALKAAIKLGLVARNVTELVDVPRMGHHEMQVFSEEQARRFIVACEGERLSALLLLALTTGMRQGEILALHWKDVQLGAGTLSVRWNLRYRSSVFTFKEPKTRRSRRRIALAGQMVENLRAHWARQMEDRRQAEADGTWQDNDLVFCTEVGTPLTLNGEIRGAFRRVLRRADLPTIRFHDLRHTCATLLLSANVNPKVVSEMLGHATVAITLDIYSHVTPDMQEDAAAAIQRALHPTLPPPLPPALSDERDE